MLKVLLQARTDAFSNYGGDTYQFEQYAQWIDPHECEITLTTELFPDLGGYDLYQTNILDMPYELYAQTKRAARFGIPIVHMPIHHRNRYMENYFGWLSSIKSVYKPFRNRHFKELAKLLMRRQPVLWTRVNIIKSIIDLQRYSLDQTKVVLLNAMEELDGIRESLGYDVEHYHLVTNGIQKALPESDPAITDKYAAMNLPDSYGVVIGRIEPRKNQLNVLRAIDGIGLPFLFLGAMNNAYEWYGRQFLKELKTSNSLYFGKVPQDLLSQIINKASISVLASWFEVVPFGSLDCHAAGIEVVTTERGYIREYFGDHASYCNPESVASIRTAIKDRLAAPAEDEKYFQDFARKYSWANSVQALLKAYELALTL